MGYEESSGDEDPMRIFTYRMTYCFIGFIVATLVTLLHLGLRSANSMPLSEVGILFQGGFQASNAEV